LTRRAKLIRWGVTDLQPPVGVVREVSGFEEGEALLQWPATLSAENVQELEDWLMLVIKKLKRRSGDKA
jgi:hypothetical protein